MGARGEIVFAVAVVVSAQPAHFALPGKTFSLLPPSVTTQVNGNITTQGYLVLWTELNKDTRLLVPHDHDSMFDCHHHVKPHPADLKGQHLVASFHHGELLVLEQELAVLLERR